MDSFGILALLQVLIAEHFGIVALFQALIGDNFGIFNTLGKNNHHPGLIAISHDLRHHFSLLYLLRN